MFESFDLRSFELTKSHSSEWVDGSGVSTLITDLNVRSLSDPCHIDELLNRNTKSRWQHWQHGPGWAVLGIDPETDERTFDGAQFKPDTPVQRYENDQPKFRRDGSPDFQKYFNASAVETTPLFLDTGIPGYWADVLTSDRRLLITEGAKKAGAALTAGEACISLPGVSSGQRKGRLKKDLARFCTVGRSLILCFDSDLFHNPNVCKALDRLGKLILERGSLVRVLLLPRETKGIDDFIVAHGQEAFKALVDEALIFEEWRKEYLFTNRKGQIRPAPKPDSTDEPLLVPLADENYILKAQSCLYSTTRWISSKGKLYQWIGTHYQEVEEEAEKRRIAAWCASTPVMTIDGWAYRYATDTHVQNIWSWVLTSFAVASSQINPPGLNCLNGVIKLSWQEYFTPVWELVPHDPAVIYNYVGQFEFDPDADPENCDRLLSCLEPEQRRIFIQTLAASLDLNMIRKFRGRGIRALLCKGEGNNGKDSLREAVQTLYGVGVVSCTVSDFFSYDQGRKFTLAKLENARISWSSENSGFSQLDNLQSLKAAITGDPIDLERKNQDERMMQPRTVFFFNINNVPNMQASLEAIKSRWAVLSFDKVFKEDADPSKGEIEADSRFRYDPNFLRKEVVPALLNKMLAALPEVAKKTIDYSCTEAALEEIQRETNHLRAFCQDVGLDEQPGGRIFIGELWDVLLEWYVKNGYAEITTDSKGKEKPFFGDPPRRSDPLVKASHRVYRRFLELFPKISREEDTSTPGKKGNWYLEGIEISGASGASGGASGGAKTLCESQSGASGAIAATLLQLAKQVQTLDNQQQQKLIEHLRDNKDLIAPLAPLLNVARAEAPPMAPPEAPPGSTDESSPTISITGSSASVETVSASPGSNAVGGIGNVTYDSSTKNFPSANHSEFKVGDRVKAKYPTSYGIPENQELTILNLESDIAAVVTYEGCRMPFGINIPLAQLLPVAPEFKEGDRVAHSNPGQKSYKWHGRIVGFHHIGESQKLFAEVKWRESRRQEPFVYELTDLRLI